MRGSSKNERWRRNRKRMNLKRDGDGSEEKLGWNEIQTRNDLKRDGTNERMNKMDWGWQEQRKDGGLLRNRVG